MRTTVQKWGNSLAVRIPNPYAKELRMTPGAVVDVTVADGTLVVAPAPAPEYRLDDLLKDITAKTLHEPVDFGEAMGREAW